MTVAVIAGVRLLRRINDTAAAFAANASASREGRAPLAGDVPARPDAGGQADSLFPSAASTPTVPSQGPKSPWQSGDSAALPAQNAARRKPTPHPPTKSRCDVARGAEGGAVTTAPLRGLLTGVGMAEIGFLRCACGVPFAF